MLKSIFYFIFSAGILAIPVLTNAQPAGMNAQITPKNIIIGYGQPMGRIEMSEDHIGGFGISLYNAAGVLKSSGSTDPSNPRSFPFQMTADRRIIKAEYPVAGPADSKKDLMRKTALNGIISQAKLGYWNLDDISTVPIISQKEKDFEARVNVHNMPGKTLLVDGSIIEGIINLQFINKPNGEYDEIVSIEIKGADGNARTQKFNVNDLS